MVSSKKTAARVVMLCLMMVCLNPGVPLKDGLAQTAPGGQAGANQIYRAGAGLPLGKVLSVVGDVVIFHAAMPDGYRARIGLPLFKGDALVAGESGHITCRLVDGSIFKLAAATKIVIDKSAHDITRKRSKSILSLPTGRAYFRVKPWNDFETREFSVQTTSVITRCRGAEFIVVAKAALNEITALANASLEITSLVYPENTIALSEFQQAVIKSGELPAVVDVIPGEEIDRLTGEFRQAPLSELSEALHDSRVEDAGEAGIDDSGASETDSR